METEEPVGRDYYALLGVERTASTVEIEKAYRHQSRQFHPDKKKNEDERKAANKIFKLLGEAKEVLTDEKKRALYDEFGTPGLHTFKEQIKELSKRDYSREELRYKFSKWQEEKLQKRLEYEVGLTGKAKMMLNVADMYSDSLNPEFQGIEIGTVTMQHEWHIPVTPTFAITPKATISADKGGSLGEAQVLFTYRLDQFTKAQLTVGLLGMQFRMLELELQRDLWKTYSGSISIKNIGPNHSELVQVVLEKRFKIEDEEKEGNKKSVYVAATVGKWFENNERAINASMSLGFAHNLVDKFSKLVALTATTTNIMLRGTFVKYLTKRVGGKPKAAMKASASISFEHWRVALLFYRMFDFKTTSKVGVSFGSEGVILKFYARRLDYGFSFPILIAHDLTFWSILAGFAIPFCTSQFIKHIIIAPRNLEKKRRREKAAEEKIAIAKKEAEDFLLTVRDPIDKCFAREQDDVPGGGLVILFAYYGAIIIEEEHRVSLNDMTESFAADPEVIDVQRALQYRVRNSHLDLNKGTKSILPGFYDPAPQKQKLLAVVYLFKNQIHEHIIRDEDILRIPLPTHQAPFATGVN